MKIGYFADGLWSHLALEKIVANEQFEIVFITPRYDSQDPVLKGWAKKLHIDFLPLANVNSPTSLNILDKYCADIFVSMSFDQILKKGILQLPKLGVINCHAGALPFYRGRNILNWALINDESEYGVTVHFLDEGIDTGDIILQKKLPITDADTYKTLLERATVACSEILYESLVKIASGKIEVLKQSSIHPVGFYCGKRKEGDEWIDWSWSSRRIFNFIRAITNPGPCACTVLDGHQIRLESSSLIPNAINYIGTPGEIVGVSQSSICVKTGDSAILLPNMSSSKQCKFIIGKRFQSKNDFVIEQINAKIKILEQEISLTKSNWQAK
ncbi:MAG: methionyl-tRNA formyltransferase [Symploca sp. SIO1B1]|nr:methionyl-tRNA formyltransferase [Symploca sp. SIO1B1]